MIDIHCHLTFGEFDKLKDEVVEDSKKEMNFIVSCGLQMDSLQAIELHKKHPNFVYLTLGLHPEEIIELSDVECEKQIEFIRENKNEIVAVGEIGLDYFWVKDEKKNTRCENFFKECLSLAEELNLPVVLHSRNAEERVFEIVSQTKIDKVVFHHYSGNMTLAKKIIEKGYYISLPTTLDRSKVLLKIAKNFPLGNLLTETDSPFNSPVKEENNFPKNVKFTLQKIAEMRNISFEKIDEIILQNAVEIFGI